MNYYSKKTPVIKDGKARQVAAKLLEQIHTERGLVHYLETRAGVNGKQLKADEPPVDFRESKLIRILLHKAHQQFYDDFLADWTCLGKLILNLSADL